MQGDLIMQRFLGTLLTLVALSLPACRRDATVDGPPDGEVAQLRNLVTQMSDSSSNPNTFRAFFSKDATVPPETQRTRYQKLYFSPVAAPVIKGDVATVQVSVRDDDLPNPLGQVEWTFVKEGEQWKAKSAPLP